MPKITSIFAAATFAGAGVLGGASAAGAEPVTQEGLVNVNLTGVTVSVPIALAANVCDVNVAVLVDQLNDAPADCEASATPTSTVETEDGGPVEQRGLVNVNITDLNVSVPIGIAANVCDVNAGVLVGELRDSPADCRSTADAVSVITG
jgi:hypothetical protein